MAPASDREASPSISGAESNHQVNFSGVIITNSVLFFKCAYRLYELSHLLQPFFVLHKASQSKPAPKIRRRIDLSPKASKGSTEECDDNLRLETFKFVWSNTEYVIKVYRPISSPRLLCSYWFCTTILNFANFRMFWKNLMSMCSMKLVPGFVHPLMQFAPAGLLNSLVHCVCTPL